MTYRGENSNPPVSAFLQLTIQGFSSLAAVFLCVLSVILCKLQMAKGPSTVSLQRDAIFSSSWSEGP